MQVGIFPQPQAFTEKLFQIDGGTMIEFHAVSMLLVAVAMRLGAGMSLDSSTTCCLRNGGARKHDSSKPVRHP